jgi:general secretion pathway protein F
MKAWAVVYEDAGKRKVVETEVYAETAKDAENKVRRRGRVLSVKKKMSFSFAAARLSQDERQILLQRLGTMLECRMGASAALKLIERTFKGAIKSTAGKMLKYVEQGDDIPTAMEHIGEPAFPRQMTALVKAGSKAGNTGKALLHAAAFEMEIDQVKRNNVWAMWFSIIGFLFAALTIFATKYYFAPKILGSELIKMAGSAVDTTGAMRMLDFSVILMGVFGFGFVLLLILGTFGRLVLPSQSDKVVVRIPFYKDLVLSRNNYITLYGLSLLVSSGVPMEQSLSLSAEGTPKGLMRDDLNNAVEAVRRGRNWAEAMRYLHPTDRAALASVQDREQAGKSLKALSDQYRTIYGQRVKATTPILMLISAGFLTLAGLILYKLGVEPILQVAAKGAV